VRRPEQLFGTRAEWSKVIPLTGPRDAYPHFLVAKRAAGSPQDLVDVTRLETMRDKKRRRKRPAPVQQDSIAFFDQLRSNHHLHRHPKLDRTTLCVKGPGNQ
jgi:hypothetical protein